MPVGNESIDAAMRRMGATRLPEASSPSHASEDAASSARIAERLEDLATKASANIRRGVASGGSPGSGGTPGYGGSAGDTGAGLAILAGLLVVVACSATNI